MLIYQCQDGMFTFWTVEFAKHTNALSRTFRVRIDVSAYNRAREKGIRHYELLRSATDDEIKHWLSSRAEHTDTTVSMFRLSTDHYSDNDWDDQSSIPVNLWNIRWDRI